MEANAKANEIPDECTGRGKHVAQTQPNQSAASDTPDTPIQDTKAVPEKRKNMTPADDVPEIQGHKKTHSAKPSDTADGGVSSIFKREKPTITSRYERFPPAPQQEQPTYAVDSEDYYAMDSFPRGELVLLNNKHFEEKTGLAKEIREGTDNDANELVTLFTKLGFVVHWYDNVNKQEMIQILAQIGQKPFSSNSCFVCAILSHGREDVVYATDGTIRIRDLTSQLRGPTMAGIPKVFLIQACRGSEVMESVSTDDAVDGKRNFVSKQEFKVSLPTEADFLCVYGTAYGYYSWRHSQLGSWFIQAVCNVIRRYAHKMDVVRMLTRVNKVVAQRKSSTTDPEQDQKRQICSIVSQLRKELYFFPTSGPL